jgi:hypothetical protein
MSKIEHFLEAEIDLSKRRLDKGSSGYYDGEPVGVEMSVRLMKKHILFCQHLLKLIAKENKQRSDNCMWCEDYQTKALFKERADAIKEFAERLKNKMVAKHKNRDGFCVYEVDDEQIDNLVKEMTEVSEC